MEKIDWRDERHRRLLRQIHTKDLPDKIRILPKMTEEATEADRAGRAIETKNVNDPRRSGAKHHGLFQGILEPGLKDVRYRRAPDVLGPDDVDLPEAFWRLPDDYEEVPYEERVRLAKEAISQAFAIEKYTLADTLPFRIRVAWRITREIARLKGLAAEDETLAAGLVPTRTNRDPWTIPTCYKTPAGGRPNRDAICHEAIHIMIKAEELEEFDQPTTFPVAEGEKPQRLGRGALALLPPEVPWRWRNKDPNGAHEILDCYDPHRDKLLQTWISLVEAIARYLQIERGTEENTEMGRLGLLGLVDPETARIAWPNRLQLLFWEEMLINDTLEMLTEKSITSVRKKLQKRHGFTSYEAMSVIKMAFELGRERTEMDVEEQRAIMVLRLEGYLERARSNMDLRAELAGFKQMAIIQGLSKADPEDTLAIFNSLVKQADEKDVKSVEVVDVKQLPPGD